MPTADTPIIILPAMFDANDERDYGSFRPKSQRDEVEKSIQNRFLDSTFGSARNDQAKQMTESNSQPEKPKDERRYSQEQFAILSQCSAEKDISKWNQWRKENPTTEVVLEGASLWRAYLKGANLEGANLQRAKLQGANLKGAKLQKAVLWEAELQGANLQEAYLQGAQLMRSHLQGAEFSGAKLEGADFSRAIVDGETLIWRCEVNRKTKFEGVSLDAARIYPEIKQLLEYNIRRMNWEEWYQWKDWYEHKPKEKRDKFSRIFLENTVKRFWWISNYGISSPRIIRVFFAFAVAFAVVYYLWGLKAPPGIIENLFEVRDAVGSVVAVPPWLVPLRALHFSVVIMTVGFTNMHANAHSFWAHIVVGLQMILGFVLLGALVTRFAVLFTAGGPAGKFAEEIKQKD